MQTASDYGPYLANEASPLYTSTIVERCTEKLVDDWHAMRCQVGSSSSWGPCAAHAAAGLQPQLLVVPSRRHTSSIYSLGNTANAAHILAQRPPPPITRSTQGTCSTSSPPQAPHAPVPATALTTPSSHACVSAVTLTTTTRPACLPACLPPPPPPLTLLQADETLGKFLDYCTYGHMIDNVVLIVTGTLHERDVQVRQRQRHTHQGGCAEQGRRRAMCVLHTSSASSGSGGGGAAMCGSMLQLRGVEASGEHSSSAAAAAAAVADPQALCRPPCPPPLPPGAAGQVPPAGHV